MRIGDLTNVDGTWVTWTDEGSGDSLQLKIRPKTGGLEKQISRKSVTSEVGVRGKMKVQNNNMLATKLLIEGCLLDWKGIYESDGEPYPFTPENAFNLLWNGPSALLQFFEDKCDQVTDEAEAGNASPSDNLSE